jgi:CRP/FNR family transcriptional regulator, cyclic AMP receptor protein
MSHTTRLPSHANTLSSGARLGGTVSHYRSKQDVYTQGAAAGSLFYIQEGEVRLTNKLKNRRSAVTAILGEGDFFGAQCLIGFPLRLSTAVAMTGSSIRSIPKQRMIDLLHTKNKISFFLVSYLLSTLKKYQDHVVALLTFTAEQRLARVLLALAHLDRKGPPIKEVPNPNHQVLADMVGTTRPRINHFMNNFRKLGYISYDGGLEVHKSLRKVLRNSN